MHAGVRIFSGFDDFLETKKFWSWHKLFKYSICFVCVCVFFFFFGGGGGGGGLGVLGGMWTFSAVLNYYSHPVYVNVSWCHHTRKQSCPYMVETIQNLYWSEQINSWPRFLVYSRPGLKFDLKANRSNLFMFNINWSTGEGNKTVLLF